MKRWVLENAAVQVVAIAVAVFVLLGFLDSVVHSKTEMKAETASVTITNK